MRCCHFSPVTCWCDSDQDKARERERVREKHLTRRMKDRTAKESVPGPTMLLGSVSDSDADETGDSRGISDVDNKSDAFGSPDGEEISRGKPDDDEEPVDDGSSSDVDSGSDTHGEMGNGQTSGRSGEKSLLMLQNQENAVLAMLAARPGR